MQLPADERIQPRFGGAVNIRRASAVFGRMHDRDYLQGGQSIRIGIVSINTSTKMSSTDGQPLVIRVDLTVRTTFSRRASSSARSTAESTACRTSFPGIRRTAYSSRMPTQRYCCILRASARSQSESGRGRRAEEPGLLFHAVPSGFFHSKLMALVDDGTVMRNMQIDRVGREFPCRTTGCYRFQANSS